MLTAPRTSTKPRESLGESAYEELRGWIAEGTIRPGSSLREVDLARKLKTSRTPVREALRRLQAEGLIQRDPRGGYVMFEFTREDLAMVYDVREALEALAVRLAAKNRTRAHLGRMADTLEAIDEAVLREDDALIETLASAFHQTIAEASGNFYLRDILSNVRGVMVRYRPRTRPYTVREKDMQEQHYAMLAALTRQDADEGERLVRAHIEHALHLRLGDMRSRTEQAPKKPARKRPAGRG